MNTINTLTANYEITRGLCTQTTSYFVLTKVKKSNCHFLASFLKIAETVNVLSTNAKYFKIFGLISVGIDFRIQSHNKLYELLNDMDIMQCVNI